MRVLLSIAALVAVVFVCSSASAAEPRSSTPDRAAQRPTRMRSVPVFVTGVVFDVLGAAATGTGTGLLIAAGNHCDDDAFGYTDRGCLLAGSILAAAGVGALAAGAVLLGIGVPLTIVGGKSVPVETRGAGSTRPRLRFSNAGMTWVF